MPGIVLNAACSVAVLVLVVAAAYWLFRLADRIIARRGRGRP